MKTMSLLLLLLFALAATRAGAAEAAHPRVVLETSKGRIVLALFPDEAPATVENFLAYVDSGFYDGTVFHRVIPDFMIQGGGFNAELQKKATGGPIRNEADNRLANDRGMVAMARTSDPHSATAQFFINTADNQFLNHTGKNPRGWGYAVFATVVEGLEVADAISEVETTRKGPFADVPVDPVMIVSVRREAAPAPAE
jgi:peptidyl-prolyl cis-trans isomerase B (cyclophilin B)